MSNLRCQLKIGNDIQSGAIYCHKPAKKVFGAVHAETKETLSIALCDECIKRVERHTGFELQTPQKDECNLMIAELLKEIETLQEAMSLLERIYVEIPTYNNGLSPELDRDLKRFMHFDDSE